MSEIKNTRDASTWETLPPPKSLRGDEEARLIWDKITKRYPNAAPLLCEMENLIENAQLLLQDLRSSYTRPLEKSDSLEITESRDDSLDTQNVEAATEVSTMVVEDLDLVSIREAEETVSIAAGSFKVDDPDDGDGSLEVREETASRAGQTSLAEVESSEISVSESPSPNLTSEAASNQSASSSIWSKTESPSASIKPVEEQTLGETSSLEGWARVVGENVASFTPAEESSALKLNPTSPPSIDMKRSVPSTSDTIRSLKEDTISAHTRRLTALKTGPMQQITKFNVLGKKEELTQRFVGTIATASNVIDTARGIEQETLEQDAIGSVEVVRTDDIGKTIDEDSTNINKVGELQHAEPNTPNESPERLDNCVEMMNSAQKGDAKSNESVTQEISPATEERSPIDILEEYSKVCGAPVEYKILSPRCGYNKSSIVKCCFVGYSFETCADSQKSARIEAAGKILRCLADRQISGDTTFPAFTRNQMEEILKLDNGTSCETALMKLYKICMELDLPEPIYTLEQTTGFVGHRFTAKCEALGYTTTGFGIRKFVAKRVAADNLLKLYYANGAVGRE